MPALVPNRHDIPSLEDVKNQSPQADCQVTSANVSRNLILNRGKPPFDNADLRRAVALSLDPKPLSIFSNGYRMEDVWLDK